MTTEDNLMAVKQIQRYISYSGMPDHEKRMFTEAEVSAYVSSWVDKGYKLLTVFKTGEAPEGALGLMYILVRE